jgi:tRNA pseudouridine32 synthase / 23S rRNA pseudouridine746 synthase
MRIDIESLVLHRDENIIILNKPAGIAVHAGRGEGPNLESFFGPLQGKAERVPALAHRLDKETSGCLVLGRTSAALKRLGLLFKEGYAEKTYLATVLGTPPDHGEISHPMGRASDDKRSWVMKVRADGDPSLTHFERLSQGDGIAALQLSPKTGRTHQLRVHCAAEGFAICGDRLYGGDSATSPTSCLEDQTALRPAESDHHYGPHARSHEAAACHGRFCRLSAPYPNSVEIPIYSSRPSLTDRRDPRDESKRECAPEPMRGTLMNEHHS